MLLPATAVAIVAVLAHRFPKRVSEKWATIVAMILFALATTVFGLYGFPAITTVEARVAQMLPFVGLVTLFLVQLRSRRADRRFREDVMKELGEQRALLREQAASLTKKASLDFVASIDSRLNKTLGETRGELKYVNGLVQEIVTKEMAPTVAPVSPIQDMFGFGRKI